MDLAVPPWLDRLRPSRRQRPAATWRWVGLVGGVVLATASWFCAATPVEFPTVWPGLEIWRPIASGSPLAATFAVLAMAAIIYSWWATRDLDVTVRWLRTTTVLWFGPLLLSASLYSRDIYSYAAQGLMLHDGLDPYQQGVQDLQSPWALSVSSVWLDTIAPYGPLFLVLARGAVVLSGGNQLAALVLLRLLAVLGVAVMVWAVPAIARRLGVDPVRATWLGVMTPIVGAHLVSGAHNDALMIAGMVAAVAFSLAHRHLLALLAVALAMTIKAPAFLLVPFLALLWAVDHQGGHPLTSIRVISRSLAAGVAALVAFVALSLATGLGFAWLPALGTPGKSNQWTSVSTAYGTLIGFVGDRFGVDITDTAIAIARGLALVVLAVLLVVIWLYAVKYSHDRRLVCQAAGLAVLAVVILSPAFHGWYLLWALPLIAATTTSRRGLTVLGLVAALLAFAVLPGGYGLALTTTWVGVPLIIVLSVVFGIRGVRWLLTYPWGELSTLQRAPGTELAAKVLPDR